MADIPVYLQDQTQEGILQRMLNNAPADLDKSEGSFVWDANAPASIELALAAGWIVQMLKFGFASTAASDVKGAVTAWVDLRSQERGVYRRQPVAASGTIRINGNPNTSYPTNGKRVASPADPNTNTAAIIYTMKSNSVTDGSGVAYVDIEAVDGGTAGNVPAGSINLLIDTAGLAGITGITNETPTSGGLDIEDDQELLARYLQRGRLPSAGGNRSDYLTWAGEVAGVGGVSIIPVEDGNGTVSVYIIDTTKSPASQTLVDTVQNYIAPPHKLIEQQGGAWVTSGSGVSTDAAVLDAIDTTAIKMVYNAAGFGLITRAGLKTYLPQPGIWTFRPSIKVNSTAGSADLLEIGVWNTSAGAWAKTQYNGSTDAKITVKANGLSTLFDDQVVSFYWDGSSIMEWRIKRLTTDTTTTVWIDQASMISTFSTDTGDGKAPIGAVVSVRSAVPISINISATLTIAAGYNAASVRDSVSAAIAEYIKSIAFQTDNDVRYSRVASTVSGVQGVQDYSNLTINGGAANVTIQDKEVAVVGVVTLT